MNAWSHLAVTSDGEHSRIYIDGELDSVGPALPVKATSGPLQIGGNEVFGEHFKGKIDEVRLYGEVLDSEEIDEDLEIAIEPANGANARCRLLLSTREKAKSSTTPPATTRYDSRRQMGRRQIRLCA